MIRVISNREFKNSSEFNILSEIELNQKTKYIGRPSIYGNPFEIGKDGTRVEVIEKFREYILDTKQIKLLNTLKKELKGKILICWCAPLACHGDVLLKLANE